MPRRKRPESERRGDLSWERMQARKFVWGPGDVEITRPAKLRKVPGQGPNRPHEGDDRPDPGRG